MLACRFLSRVLIVPCVMLFAGCHNTASSRSGFRRTLPTVFTNSDGATIKISTEGMLAGGKFFAATDCSNKQFNCFIYGDRTLLITPKACFTLPVNIWRVGNHVAQYNGYDQHSSSDVVQTNFGNGAGYGFSEIEGKGINSIAYDVTGTYHAALGEYFYANIPSTQMASMLYFSPVGPAFLPCKNKREQN